MDTLENILESISDGVFTVDLNWRIIFFNKAAESITGVNRKDAVGKFCWEVFKSSMCEANCSLKKTIKTGKPIVSKLGYIITNNGNKKPVSVSTAVLKNSNGDVVGAAETFRDLSEIEKLKSQIPSSISFGELSSKSESMKKVIEIVKMVSNNSATLLITGETGTGKEIIAKTVHNMGSRRDKPFIAVNCAALPENLLESELFGYKKGAFTSADKDKPGRFELAKGGTIFLDEIGDMPVALQVKLLRVLQERKYEPLGGVESITSDARIICATNRNLEEMVKNREFRKDLYYRINVLSVELPPLKDRIDDIADLTQKFIDKYNRIHNRKVTGVDPQVYAHFYSYSWPGNIRELENVIERAVVLCKNSVISKDEISIFKTQIENNSVDNTPINKQKELAEKKAIESALDNSKGNRTKAAKDLAITKATLYRKISKYKINLPEFDGRNKSS